MPNYLKEFEEKWIRKRKAPLEYRIYVWAGFNYASVMKDIRITDFETACEAAQKWSQEYARSELVKVCLEDIASPLALFINGKQITEKDNA